MIVSFTGSERTIYPSIASLTYGFEFQVNSPITING
jgi:hypothetical protein